MVVSTATGEYHLLLVLLTQGFEVGTYLLFRHGFGQIIFFLQTYTLRNIGKEVVNTVDANFVEHLTDVVRCVGNVFVHGRNVGGVKGS